MNIFTVVIDKILSDIDIIVKFVIGFTFATSLT